MLPQRLEQLDRARKLGANIHVLLGRGTEAPIMVELNQLKSDDLETHEWGYVQVSLWRYELQQITIAVRADARERLTESSLAAAVDRALERFEAKYGPS